MIGWRAKMIGWGVSTISWGCKKWGSWTQEWWDSDVWGVQRVCKKKNAELVSTVPVIPFFRPTPTREPPSSNCTQTIWFLLINIPLLCNRDGTLSPVQDVRLIVMILHMTLLNLSHTLTYHHHIQHSIHWTLLLNPSADRLLRRIQSGMLLC
jgi:hypothetical protein